MSNQCKSISPVSELQCKREAHHLGIHENGNNKWAIGAESKGTSAAAPSDRELASKVIDAWWGGTIAESNYRELCERIAAEFAQVRAEAHYWAHCEQKLCERVAVPYDPFARAIRALSPQADKK